MFYHKMKGDCYRFLAEFSNSDAESKAAEDARMAYAEILKITAEELVMVPV